MNINATLYTSTLSIYIMTIISRKEKKLIAWYLKKFILIGCEFLSVNK